VTVKNGKKVSVRYKADDGVPTCGKATVTLRFSKGRALKKTVAASVAKLARRTPSSGTARWARAGTR